VASPTTAQAPGRSPGTTSPANAAAGVCFALFFLLHPGGGDPPTVAAAGAAFYTPEHGLGLAAMALMLLGLSALAVPLPPGGGWPTRAGYALAFVGAYLLGGVLFFDAFISPVLARHAPALLDPTGPLNTPPVLLALALPGVVWGLGYLLLAGVALRGASLPRPASALVAAGALLVNLPPEPVGPVPLWVLVAGAVLFGVGLTWWGLAPPARRASTLVGRAGLTPAAPGA